MQIAARSRNARRPAPHLRLGKCAKTKYLKCGFSATGHPCSVSFCSFCGSGVRRAVDELAMGGRAGRALLLMLHPTQPAQGLTPCTTWSAPLDAPALGFRVCRLGCFHAGTAPARVPWYWPWFRLLREARRACLILSPQSGAYAPTRSCAFTHARTHAHTPPVAAGTEGPPHRYPSADYSSRQATVEEKDRGG